MSQLRKHRPAAATLAACVVLGLGGITAARADVVTSSPSLPLLDIPYTSSENTGCFTLAAACVSDGSLTLTSIVSSTFDGSGQEIVADASYAAVLTDLLGNPIGTVDLTGTFDETVLGRSSDTDTGSWDTQETGMTLSGAALDDTLSMSVDPDNASTGTTTITGNPDATYLVDSFFSMFVDLSLNSAPVQTSAQGPIQFAVSVVEPSSLALLVVPLLALAVVRRRRY